MRTKKINSHRSIENFLRKYKSIDRQTAFTHFKCPNLTAVLSNLKKEGWELEYVEGYAPNSKWRVVAMPPVRKVNEGA